MEFLERARELEPQIIAWRRDIHAHPELGFQETRTARLVAETLQSWGMEVEVGVGITGVVARIGEGHPAVGIRADMDALPIEEATGLPYASTTPGVMHACGHDAHTAILMGVAKMLNEMPNRPTGEVRFIFQPCEEKFDEEGWSGASRMIADKALEELDSVIALHVSSYNPSGQVRIGEGHVLAAVDSFEAVVKGEGTHGASPHLGVDPIFIQAQIINAIQGIRGRRLNPTEPSVISIGSIHAGNAFNVIPNEVQITGTIRSYSEETRAKLHEELEKAFAVSRALGGDYELKIHRGYPSLYNAPQVADLIRQVSVAAIGEERTQTMEPIMGAEDFAYMTQKAPGAMFFLGAKRDEVNRPHHSPIFDIDESALHVGAAVLAETTYRLLRGGAG